MAKRCSKRRRTRRGGIYEGRQGGLEAVPFGRIVHSGGGRKKMARTRRRTRRGGFKFTPYDGVNDI